MNEYDDQPILQVRNLCKQFPVRRGVLRREVGTICAVDDVSFTVRRGMTLGLVGESGCGKTTTSRMILRAIDPTSGSIVFRRPGGQVVDLASLTHRQLRPVRGELQMIFQDPYNSLNPRMPVLELIAEPLRSHGWKRAARHARVHELMELVGLDPRYAKRFPHAFSGGQRQRIGIARALALQPSMIVADEPVSALDVSVQAQILNLLIRLREQLGLTFLFVAHDLGVIRYLCDEVAVMYQGRIVEWGLTEVVFNRPQHPYTDALLRAAPVPDPDVPWLGQQQPTDEVEDAETPASPSDHLASPQVAGCPFRPRCAYATEICQQQQPALIDHGDVAARPHFTSCHHATRLNLAGMRGNAFPTGSPSSPTG